MGRNEDTLLAETVNDDKDGGKSVGLGKLLNEVHGDGVPGTFSDRKLLQKSIRPMSAWLTTKTLDTGLAVVLSELTDLRPDIVTQYQLGGLLDTRMTCEDMIVSRLSDAKSKVSRVGDIDAIVEEQETVRGECPPRG